MVSEASLKNKRVLFIGGANGKDELVFSISKELEKRYNINSFYISTIKGGREYFLDKEVPKNKTYSLYYLDEKKLLFKPNLKFIRNAERKYNFKIWDIWQITAPRKRSRLKFKSEQVLRWGEYITKRMEKVVEEVKPDYVVFLGIAGFVLVIMHNVLKENNAQILNIVNARIPGRFTFNDNLQDQWPLLVKEYNKIKNKKLTTEEINFAENFIVNFREKPFKPDDSAKIKVPFSKKFEKYILYLKILRHRKSLPSLRQFFVPLTDKLMKWSGLFEMPVKGEKYVFYPLHIDPEASTSIYGKWYVNQLDLIEKISKSIPSDYMLYVKEHVWGYSTRPKWYHGQIKKFPNVRLISPYVNTISLIKNSSLVFTITGTVGWESTLLQKPVIAFGDIYYNIFDEINKIKDIRDLPTLIENKIDTKIDKMKILKFITALFKSTFNGVGTDPGDNFASLNEQNISLIVDGIEGFVNRIHN